MSKSSTSTHFLFFFFFVVVFCITGTALAKKEDTHYIEQKESELSTRTRFKRDNYTSFHIKLGIEAGPDTYDDVLAYLTNATGANVTSLDEPFDSIFFPKVDEFALMRLDTRELVGLNVTVRAWVEIGGNRSESRIMVNNDYAVGSRSVVISLDSGNITAIDWDDNCDGCRGNACLDGACAINADTIDPACDDPKELEMDPYRCGTKVYLVWVGTDVDGKPMKSINKLPSSLTKFSFVNNVADIASGIWNDIFSAWRSPDV